MIPDRNYNYEIKEGIKTLSLRNELSKKIKSIKIPVSLERIEPTDAWLAFETEECIYNWDNEGVEVITKSASPSVNAKFSLVTSKFSFHDCDCPALMESLGKLFET